MLYKITGVWGNHEGSLLLWVLILTLFGACAAGSGATCRRRSRRACWRCNPRSRRRSSPSSSSRPTRSRGRDAALRRAGPEPAPAGPGPRLPSAVPLPRLRRPLDGLLLRRRRPDRGARRRRLGPLGAALDAGGLGVPDHRHRAGVLVGLLRAWLGRVLVLGPGRKRLLHALADRRGAAAFRHRGRKARGAEAGRSCWPSSPSASR
jgi:hypothetical protein